MVKKPNEDVPVYVVEGEDGKKKRTLHRNLLLPLGSKLKNERVGESRQDPVERRKSRRQGHRRSETDRACPRRGRSRDEDRRETESEESSVEEEDLVAFYPAREENTDVESSSGGDAHSSSEGQEDPEDEQPESVDSEQGTQPRQEVGQQHQPAAAESEETEVKRVDGGQETAGDQSRLEAEPTREQDDLRAPPTPAPRTSTRTRSVNPPAWMRSNDYVFSQQLSSTNPFRQEELPQNVLSHSAKVLQEAAIVLKSLPESAVMLFMQQIFPNISVSRTSP